VVASAGEGLVVKLWDLATRRVLHSLKAHAATVCGLTFSPDGRHLASGSRDGMIVLWDVAAGTEVRVLRGDAESFSRIQLSPDGRLLAAGGHSGLVKLWDAATGKVRDPLPGHAGFVRCVAFSPDGKWLASGGEDRTVVLHHLTEGRSQKFSTLSAVNDVAFSSDGRTIAAVGAAPEAAVRLWDLQTGKETTWQGHTGEVHGLAFSPAGPLLATCAEDGTVRLWDYSTGTPRVRVLGPGPFGGGVRAVAFTPDGRYLTTANANAMVYVLRFGEQGILVEGERRSALIPDHDEVGDAQVEGRFRRSDSRRLRQTPALVVRPGVVPPEPQLVPDGRFLPRRQGIGLLARHFILPYRTPR
jgi:WD40 repeat protein